MPTAPNKTTNINPSKANPGNESFYDTNAPDTAFSDQKVDLSKQSDNQRLDELKMQSTGSMDDRMKAMNEPSNPLDSSKSANQ